MLEGQNEGQAYGLNCVSSKIHMQGDSLVLQWVGLSTFTAEGPGSVPGQGPKIPQASRSGIYIYIYTHTDAPVPQKANLFGCNLLSGHHTGVG